MLKDSAFIRWAAAVMALASTPAWADFTCDGGNRIFWFQLPGSSPAANNCLGSTGFRCHEPKSAGTGIELVNPACDPKAGPCDVRLTVDLEFPGVAQTFAEDGVAVGQVFWFAGATSPPCTGSAPTCGQIGVCGVPGQDVIYDSLRTYVVKPNVTCATALSGPETFSLTAWACPTISGCRKEKKVEGLVLGGPKLARAIGCPVPRKERCESCTQCLSTGPCSVNVGGQGPACKAAGPGADLYYAASGVGNPGLPGAAAWAVALGRNWSSTYHTRVVVDPDDSHVWLLEKSIFREFSGLVAGVYTTVSPSSEKRKLTRTAGGWELRELDGTVHAFDNAGFWASTTDRSGNAKLATYSGGQLTSVAFQDGRKEDFSYDPTSGKLASITEVGVGGSPSRTWSYSWVADDLTFIERPDGTAWEIFYDGSTGRISRWELIGTDLSRRVEAAFEYSQGNVIKSWRGDPSSTGPNAIEVTSFSYDNPGFPSQATVTDPLGKVTTYTIARDTVSDVPKITQVSGDCPTCGVGPNAVFTYADPANPLLATQVVDGRGLITQMAFNASGMMTSKTEAVGTPLARTATWEYGEPDFPAFPTRIEMPSTAGGSAMRVTVLDYDNATGDLLTRTIQGAEAGESFSFATATTYNTAGQPLTIDPPGYSATDQTGFTYDPTRGDLVPLTRTDALIGGTQFGHDGYNRRTSVIDPNNVETVTGYDDLNRVTSVNQKGATPAEDLVTSHEYSPLGDLSRTTLPRGNVIAYDYDPAGRLTSIERKPDLSTPGERTFYTLDSYGHRIKEELQRWNGSAWVTESLTDFVYSTRCHLDRVVHADGSVTEYDYDCAGNLQRVWDANHTRASNPTPTQLYQHDELNRMKSVTQPWAGAGGGTAVTQYSYDVQDHLSGVIDAEGNVTTYVYGDRDLMTDQISPVSGTTTYAYNEHGELFSETDARGVTVLRTIDELDRVTVITYPDDPVLNIVNTFDDSLVPFAKGRLTRISRNVTAIDYRYDRFGRVLQDGELTMAHDPNGNVTSLVYPGGVEAVSTYDFADRPASLLARRAGKPDQPLVTTASYRPFGPLATLSLGNGLSETRGFDQRYYPESITLAGGSNLLQWSYITDDVGNVTSITDALNAANNRTYGYLDHQYFLTLGNGPWGARSWGYDRIGNRLTETRGAVTDIYSYPINTNGGRSPILTQVQLGGGGTRTYQFGPAGHLEKVATGADETLFRTDAAGRLGQLERPTTRGDATFWYEGRDFLAFADPNDLPFREGFESGNTCAWAAMASGPASTPCPGQEVRPTYSSEGLLLSLLRNAAPQRSHSFYFGGRPVAQLDLTGGVESWKYLTTDHLGTPIVATNTSGALVWQGGFEPFGADWSNASGAGVFLRFPGQWREGAWETASLAPGLYHNVHRWYETGTGRYTRPDPFILDAHMSTYSYADANPTRLMDWLGLVSTQGQCGCCSDQDQARELRQIQNWLNRNGRKLRKRFGFRDLGCGDAADLAVYFIEQDVKPKCWITRNQMLSDPGLLYLGAAANWLALGIFGTNVSIHAVPTFRPCLGHGSLDEDLYADPYYGRDQLRSLPTRWRIELPTDTPPAFPVCPYNGWDRDLGAATH